jgi:hypothetical protein
LAADVRRDIHAAAHAACGASTLRGDALEPRSATAHDGRSSFSAQTPAFDEAPW